MHDDLVAILDGEAIAHTTLTKYLREPQTNPYDVTALYEEVNVLGSRGRCGVSRKVDVDQGFSRVDEEDRAMY
jgi:hypothetical protein